MKKGPPLIVSLVLALVGVGALAAAVLLVPPMVRQFASLEVAAKCAKMEPPIAAAGETPPRAVPQNAPAPVNTVPVASGEGDSKEASAPASDEQSPFAPVGKVDEKDGSEKPVADEPPDEGASGGATGPWTISLDESSYEIAPEHKGAIDEIVAALSSKGSAVVEVTGVNHPNKSSKRAKKGASVVRDEITADVGIQAWRVKAKAAQEPDVDGLEVRVVLKGGE